MKQGRTDRDWTVVSCLAFIAGIVVAWALCTPSNKPASPSKIDWPAWVQAVGSVGAILVAVYIPTRISDREHRSVRQEKLYQARGLAFVLRPLVQSAAVGIYTAQERWKRCPDEYDDDAVAEHLIVPQALMDRLLDLHILGDAGIAVQSAIVAINSLRTGIFSQYAYWRYGGMYYDYETGDGVELCEPEDVDTLCQVAVDAIQKAEAELGTLLAT